MFQSIGKKVVRLQDSFFKKQPNNSNETSIFLSHTLSESLNLVKILLPKNIVQKEIEF